MIENIYAAYSLITGWFNDKNLQERFEGSHSWIRMRELNDYAYFVLLFAQLEDHVNVHFQQMKDLDFEVERHYPGRIDFMQKVYAVFNGNRMLYDLIDRYYEVRNEIAHGRDLGEGLFVRYVKESSRPITIDSLYENIKNYFN